MSRKVGFLGGGGVRTPLVVFGINEAAAQLDADEIVLYDLDRPRTEVIARLCREVVRANSGSLRVRIADRMEEAIEGSDFILNSVRVGGIASRAEDERAAIGCGYPGQETTGPGGVAMGQRTIPVAIAQARLVEKLAPSAWLINFTNPAGLITQAMQQNSDAKIVGICDTPTEMIHRIQTALDATAAEVECEYVGLNHLGWFKRIVLHGQDVTARLLADDDFLSQLYSAPLFDHEMIRALGLIPTEYLFFYYSRRRALENQLKQGSTRGEEIARMNETLMGVLARSDDAAALQAYVDYLNARSGSYMKIEGEGSTEFDAELMELDPFRAASGYHRIALDVMTALVGDEDRRVIVNVRNGSTIPEIEQNDTVEALSVIRNGRIAPLPVGPLPESVRGLVLAVKAYERVAIEAAISGSERDVRKAMLLYPSIGEWEPSEPLLRSLKMR